jgi:hypothetical protein
LRQTQNSIAALRHFHPILCPNVASIKPDIPPDWRWRVPMKTMILAALTVLSLGGVANAQSFAHEMPPSWHHGAKQ